MRFKNSNVISYDLGKEKLIIYHSLLNKPKLIEFYSESEKNKFKKSLKNKTIITDDTELNNFCNIEDAEVRSFINKRNRRYLKATIKRIKYLSLLLSENCNLGCSYCFASMNMNDAKIYKIQTMSWEVAKRAIDWFVNLPQNKEEFYINFSGGEPLVNKKILINVFDYVNSLKISQKIKFNLNTNATLVDKKLATFLAKNNVEIGTSLDGIPIVSDKVRVLKNGIGASKKIIEGWDMLLDAGCELTGFMATFNDKNIEYLDEKIVDFALDRKFKWLRIAWDVIHMIDYPAEEVADRIWNVYQYGYKNNILVEGFWSTAINNLIEYNKPEEISFFCGAVAGETISIHPNGRISACGYSSANYGNILNNQMLDNQKHTSLVRSYLPGNKTFCLGCEIEGSCAGGCNITEEVAIGELNNNTIKYNCNIYKELTKRLLQHHFLNEVKN